MNKIKKMNKMNVVSQVSKVLIFVILVAAVLLSVNHITFAVEFPETNSERKANSMESLFGKNTLALKLKSQENDNLPSEMQNANTYLYRATIEYFHFTPLAVTENVPGVMSSNWYIPADEPSIKFKFKIMLDGKVVSDEAIKIMVYQKNRLSSSASGSSNGGSNDDSNDDSNSWSKEKKNTELSESIKQKILARARELYLEATAKQR